MANLQIYKNYYLPILLIVSVLIFIFNLDVIYVNIMEARNFITAREMITHKNWLLTTMNNLPRYEKPPLPTWLTAISGWLFGFKSRFAMRLPAALSTILLLIFFYKLLPKFKISLKQSFFSSLILASSFYIIFSGRNGQWDIFTHAFMMVSIYYLWKFFSSENAFYKNAILAAIFFGFSFMSKGPVSLYALLLPFLIAYGIVYKYKNFKKKWLPLFVFLVISAIISAWWFVYVRLADPDTFLEITSREAGRWGSYNVRPFYYYWSFFTQSGIWTIPSFVALLYPYLKNRVSNKKAYLFSFLWTVLSVILLSIIPEKKSRYLLPVLIPMAFNTGFYVEYLCRKFAEIPLKEKLIVYFNHGLIAIIGIAFPIAAYFVLDLEGFWFYFIATSILLVAIGFAKLLYLKRNEYSKVFYLTIAFICVVMAVGFPLTNALLDNPKFKNIAELQTFAEKRNIKVYEFGVETPELIWEFGAPIPQIHGKKSFPTEEKFGVITNENDQKFLNRIKDKYKILETERYDLNYVNPKKSGYKNRLIRTFYLLKRIN
ncbi:ArnT family glycosyltransferase [Mesonia maritima]|uniref:4-amino-4-deoxy-L-arabinose transferase-like glycosyltransferase n=1 Tax=Mesonia maritima TaxID=1793873 RepID=A0ABU1K4G8_9FLAO|nr:phospholipid carrier-dependent glycosyltransferase [Mesonia maritima]MDR6300510.1 4-amino-4-deoxy-L-arabinose transferase-like glycosyltransferase [Mesonia maritima]